MACIRKNIIRVMVKKEFKQLLRDPRMRGVLFGAPVIMVIVFGFAVTTEVKNIKLAVLDEDNTSLTRTVTEKFTASDYFGLAYYLYADNELDRLMDTGEIDLFIRYKKGLSKKLRRGQKTEIQVIIDGSDTNRAAIISAYTREIFNSVFYDYTIKLVKRSVIQRKSESALMITPEMMDRDRAFKMKKPFELVERVFFNQTLDSRNYFLPGVIGLLVSLITIMLTSMSIVKERETGTIDQIIVSPMNPAEYIIGKTLPYAIIGIIDMTVVSLIAMILFNVPFNGSFVFLLFSGTLFVLSSLSVGLYISTISKTQQQAMLSTFLFFIPAFLFSGFIFPIYTMPEVVQIITYANPMAYFIEIIRGVFLKGTGIVTLWDELLPMTVIGIVLIFLATRRFKRRLE